MSAPPPEGLTFDAVVLAGGRAQRLGTSKPRLVVAGARLLDHVLAATRDARATVVVGPEDLASDAYLLTREDPPFGGPVAGVAAGLAALPGAAAPWVLLLACDVPEAARAVPLLVAAASGPEGGPAADPAADPVTDEADEADAADGVCLAHDGRDQWLVGLYRRDALDAAVARLAGDPDGLHGASVRRLVSGLRLTRVADVDGLSTDVDTWQDAETYAFRARFGTPRHDPHGSSGGMS
ncbi:molybdenum cofactor guanylyltransferase [Oerskovia turbata]